MLSYIKIGKEILKLWDIEIEKSIYRHKSPIFSKDVDIDQVSVPNNISLDEKKPKQNKNRKTKKLQTF